MLNTICRMQNGECKIQNDLCHYPMLNCYMLNDEMQYAICYMLKHDLWYMLHFKCYELQVTCYKLLSIRVNLSLGKNIVIFFIYKKGLTNHFKVINLNSKPKKLDFFFILNFFLTQLICWLI